MNKQIKWQENLKKRLNLDSIAALIVALDRDLISELTYYLILKAWSSDVTSVIRLTIQNTRLFVTNTNNIDSEEHSNIWSR